jgi:hypothetical protein
MPAPCYDGWGCGVCTEYGGALCVCNALLLLLLVQNITGVSRPSAVQHGLDIRRGLIMSQLPTTALPADVTIILKGLGLRGESPSSYDLLHVHTCKVCPTAV